MNDHTREASSSKIDARFEVKRWLNRGIKCVPLKPGSKQPSGGEGWNTLRINESTINEHFQSTDNIGGLWGKASNWIIDIDLDWNESAIIGQRLLPNTFIYGRINRPKTHYLYRCVDSNTEKWKAGSSKDETIVEFRSTGSQSVLPPSKHPDNDRYTINNEIEFTTINYSKLHRLIDLIAALSLLARYYPKGQGRHDYISAIAGALSRSTLNDDEIIESCLAVLDAADDREDDVAQRTRTIRNTLKKAREGTAHTYGWPTIGESMPGLMLSRAKTWIDRLISQPMPVKIRSAPGYELPAHLLSVPGLVGEIAHWASQRAYVRQPVIDIAAGFMCTAMVTLNRYIVEGWDTPLQPYMMILAPTAGGKESALNSVYEFCRRLRLGDFCFQGFQSYHSLLDKLAEPTAIACWLWDEAARKLKTAGRGTGSQDYQVMTHLLSLYGRAASNVPGMTARQNTIPAMNHPFLTILAASQGGALMEAVTEADLSTGVVNRFILMDCGDEVAEENEKREVIFPSRLEAAAKLIRDRTPNSGGFYHIGYAPSVYAMFREFNKRARNQAVNVEIWGRANQNALILAGILAVGMGDKKPIIDEACARWAIDFITWTLDRWEVRMRGSVARTQVEGHSKTVEGFIVNARSIVGRAGLRGTQTVMLKMGKMPRAVLTRLCRHLNARELDAVILQLKQGELIAESEENDMTIYAPL